MAVDELKQRILELLAVWSRDDAERLGDFYHTDVMYHGLPYGFPPGLAGAAQFYHMSRGAFPDLRYAPSHLIRDGDMVAVRITAQGTQRGLYLGYAPTGRFARWTGSQIFTFRGDKIAEVWSIWDRFGLLQQLGIIKDQPHAGAEPEPELAEAPYPLRQASPETVARNKNLIRRMVDQVLNQGRLEVVDEIVAPEFIAHPELEGFGTGREGFKAFARQQLEVAADHRMVVEGLVGEGDLVATRVIAFSTPRKPIVGSASGTWRMVPMIGTYRIADNQIAERWINADVLGTLAQLGEFPILRELE